MVVLPMKIEGISLCMELKLKDVHRKKEVLKNEEFKLNPSDLAVGGVYLSSIEDHEFYNSHETSLTRMIRKNTKYYNIKNIYVTTKSYPEKDFYDVYKISIPKENNEIVDYVFGKLVNDIRLHSPLQQKGVQLSLTKLGIDQLFSEEIIKDIIELKGQSKTKEEFLKLLYELGYGTQIDILNFFNSSIQFHIIDNTLMSSSYLDNTISIFESIHGKEEKALSSFKKISQENGKCYLELAKLNQLIYDEPLKWPILSQDQQKILQKRVA